MEDGDPGDWENGKTETYEISAKNWREVYGGRLIRRTSIHYDNFTPFICRSLGPTRGPGSIHNVCIPGIPEISYICSYWDVHGMYTRAVIFSKFNERECMLFGY
jgi:hypothetical protein